MIDFTPKYCKETGEVGVGGHAFMIVNRNVNYYFQKALEDLVGPVARTLIYHAHKHIAEICSIRLVDALNEHKSVEERFKIIQGFSHAMGIGEMKIIKIDEKQKKATVRIFNCSNADSVTNSDHPICDSTRGLLAGASSILFQTNMHAEEVKCRALGDEYCEFELSPSIHNKPVEKPYCLTDMSKPCWKPVPHLKRKDGILYYRDHPSTFTFRINDAEMQRLFTKYIGAAAKGVSYEFGYRAGKEGSREQVKHINPLIKLLFMKKAIEGMLASLTERGYGIAKLVTWDPNTKTATIRVKNSYNAEGYKNEKETKCWIFSGILAGSAENLFGRPMKCIETKCIAKGDPYCEFVITPRE